MYGSSRIIAKFKGTDGSLGYRQGQIYILNMGIAPFLVPNTNFVSVAMLAIERAHPAWQIWKHRDGFCPYSSDEAFLANWDVLETVKPDQVNGVPSWLPLL